MVSRRKILSRSRDDLNLDQTFSPQEEEEDVWYQKDKLYKEHIQEVLDKWTQIDDEIWAKVIVFERNRRVAKAYARAPVLTINGSDDGFDGMRIGLCGFDNPMRDQKTDEFKRHIGQGVKIKMDDAGNILIRRYAKSNVYVKSTASSASEETSIGADILKLPNQALESEKIVKLFDMKKFQSNVNRELRRAYPDRRRLETQCLSAVAFVKSENDILECPIWVLIVNVVAMDMLKSKLPPVQRPMVDIKNRPRIPIPDEDPYSVAGNGSGGSSGSSGFGANNGHQQQSANGGGQIGNGVGNMSNGGSGGVIAANMHLNNGNAGHVAATREQLLMQTQQLAHKRSEKPPKLPPRDNIYAHDLIPKPDYDDIDVESRIKLSRGKSDKGKDNKKYDDPYYCGLRARVPNFVKSSGKSNPAKSSKDLSTNGHAATNGNGNASNIGTLSTQKKNSIIHMPMGGAPMHPAIHVPTPPHMHPHHIQQQQMMALAAAQAVHHPAAAAHHHHQMWQTRSYESGIGIYSQLPAKSATNFIVDQVNQASSLSSAMAAGVVVPVTGATTPVTVTTTDNQTLAMPATDVTGLGLGRPNPVAKPLRHGQLQSHVHSQTHSMQQQHSRHHHHRHHHRHASHGCAHRSEMGPTVPPPYYHHHPQMSHRHHASQQEQQHLPFQDKYPSEHAPKRHAAAPHTRRSSIAYEQRYSPQRTRLGRSQSIVTNCNCVSCYTLAPLFGAVPPQRPPRSLSQQQLRQHQKLSGALNDTPAQHAMVKWCSESDISELEREQAIENEDDGFGGPMDDLNLHYNLDMELDLDVDYMQLQKSTRHKKLREARPTEQYYNNTSSHAQMMQYNRQTQTKAQFEMLEQAESLKTQEEDDYDEAMERLTDGYVETRTRLRQRLSPERPVLRQTQHGQRHKGTALWAARNKSQSIESFFEQPNEEGSLYMYGGRQRMAKAPSTTNIYDRVRNSNDSDQFYSNFRHNSQMNLNGRQRSNRSNHLLTGGNDDYGDISVKPALPPPSWQPRGKRHEFLARNQNNAANNNNGNNNNNIYYNNNRQLRSDSKDNNLHSLQSMQSSNNDEQQQMNNMTQQQQMSQQQQQQQLQQKTDLNEVNQKQQLRPTATAANNDISTNAGNNNDNNNNTTINTLSDINNNKQTQLEHQQQQQQQPSQRTSRPSRIDMNDMESIYGYLKPRKPRSLSLKKIQILDY